MAEKIKKMAIKAYLKMLGICSVLLLGIVWLFSSKSSLAQYQPEDRQVKYGVQVETVKYNMRKQWKGVSLSKAYLEDVHKVIKDKACFEKEWKKFGISAAFPKVNFTKEMVIEIVKKDSPKELMLEEAWYARETNNEIFYNSYFDSGKETEELVYLFVVIRRSELPISFQENRFIDGKCVATYTYLPVKCD